MTMDRAKQRIKERRNKAQRSKKAIANATRPKLCVRRSLKHISAQIIDLDGNSVVQVSSLSDEVSKAQEAGNDKSKTAAAKLVGEAIAAKALEKGLKDIVFDRRGYLYRGRVKALADAARKKGLAF
jgi:large subunit ribosomal protein L18